jgi:hypothetical protein
MKDLVDAVSADTNIPAAQVRKVTQAVLKQFAGLIDNQTKFTSAVIHLTPAIAPARPARDDRPAVPERKFARMAVRVQKPKAAPES